MKGEPFYGYGIPKTKAQRRAYLDAVKAGRKLEVDAQYAKRMARHMPQDWVHFEEWHKPDWKPKTKVTLRVDDVTLKYFKAMGPGYSTRLNLVLRYYTQMQLAGFLKGDEMEVEEVFEGG
ncbi:BrnA antitoxin family protein [Nereida sp. MMG025]|uniref:BrnA antitoxin family protein n=1 Tax=Nereida sp. MMG025 TaxID=2909981 RepID=UPI001F3D9DA0|nr:BrnA antitoxin family protein [Nereida sp. MMG025]MCF6444069.1 BrnA antitoxin family protein [Nereida sp. MMG025]